MVSRFLKYSQTIYQSNRLNLRNSKIILRVPINLRKKSYGKYKGRMKPYFVTLVRYENNRYELQLQSQNVKQLFTPWGNEIQNNPQCTAPLVGSWLRAVPCISIFNFSVLLFLSSSLLLFLLRPDASFHRLIGENTCKCF